jgi:pimeloyl-ACP methyl ester carboxylesterase
MLTRQRRLGAAVAILLLAAMALAACGSDDSGDGEVRAADEPADTTTSTTEATTTTTGPDVATEDVTFTSADGVQLAGRLYGSGTTAIVASHQANRSKADFASSGPRLAAAGFTVLAYDGRGDGASSPGDPAQRVQDLIAAVDLVRSRGATKVFLLGASRGGALSLTGATQTPVDGVVTLSAPPPAEGAASVSAVTVPSLYVNSENDDFADSTQAMYDAANEPRQLQMYPGGGHGVALFATHTDLVDLITTFVREHGGA